MRILLQYLYQIHYSTTTTREITGVIHIKDVQVMSAGTGIYHSEFNASNSQKVSFLQIRIFPKAKNVMPRYDRKSFDPAERKSRIQCIASPISSPPTLMLNQDAFISRIDPDVGHEIKYTFNKKSNGLYFFLIQREIFVNNEQLKK